MAVNKSKDRENETSPHSQVDNEEVKASSVEVVSINEEHLTVIKDLSARVDELETRSADLQNLLAASDVATIFLDTDLAIHWFTPRVQEVVRLREMDKGRPLADISADGLELAMDAERVLNTLTPIEDKVVCQDSRTFVRRVTPYRTDDDHIGGVVITFFDVTDCTWSALESAAAEQARRESEQQFQYIFETAGVSVWLEDFSEVKQVLDQLRRSGVSDLRTYLNEHPDFVRRMIPMVRILDVNQETIILFGAKSKADLLGSLANIFTPQSHQVFVEELIALDEGRDMLKLEAPLKTLDGRPLTVLVTLQFNQHNHDFSHVVVTLTDITHRKTLEQKLQELNASLEYQISERTAILKMLQDVTRSANAAHTVEEAMHHALTRIAQYNGWQVGHVWRLADDGSGDFVSSGIWHTTKESERAVGWLDEFKQISEQTRFSPGQVLIGAVAQENRPYWIDDIAKRPSCCRGDAEKLGLHAAIAFPVTVGGVVVAVMEFFSDHAAKRDKGFIEVMPDVGIQLGYVVHRKRMEKVVEEIAMEEQRRIGRELHDGIAQNLTGGALIAESLRQSLAENQPKQLENAAHLVEIFKTTHEDVRTLSSGLMIGSLEASELPGKLHGLAHEVSQRFGVPCILEASRWGTKYVCNDVTASAIFHITREAVHNAVKHANAKRIAIEVTSNGSFGLAIRDDGIGFDVQKPRKNTNGLRIMKYRAESVGGTVQIESTSQHGTTIKLTIPHWSCQ